MHKKRDRDESLKMALLNHEAVESDGTRTSQWRVLVLVQAAALLALIVLLTTAAGAASAETPSSLDGRWELAATADEEQQRLRVIDDATQHLPRFQRGRARDMLAGRTSPPESLTISLEDSTVTIGPGGRELELELGGPPIEASGDQGKAQVSARMEGEQLIIVADSGKGVRTSTYRADGDRLAVEVTMTGAKLSEPLNYVSTFERVK
jgi:hypothetical protein